MATIINVNHCRLASLSRLRQCVPVKETQRKRDGAKQKEGERNTDRLGGAGQGECKNVKWYPKIYTAHGAVNPLQF